MFISCFVKAQKALTNDRINEVKRKLDKLKSDEVEADEYLFSAVSNKHILK